MCALDNGNPLIETLIGVKHRCAELLENETRWRWRLDMVYFMSTTVLPEQWFLGLLVPG